MTAELSGSGPRAEPRHGGPVEDDATWWDRHGWDGTPGIDDLDPAVDDVAGSPWSAADPDPDLGADAAADAAAGPLPASRLVTAFLVVGTLLTLPMVGLAGGYGRVLAPAAWALLGLAASLVLTGREPVWDLGRPRRAEPALAWAGSYLTALAVGLDVPVLVGAWWFWVPATLVAALAPLVVAHRRWPDRVDPRAGPAPEASASRDATLSGGVAGGS